LGNNQTDCLIFLFRCQHTQRVRLNLSNHLELIKDHWFMRFLLQVTEYSLPKKLLANPGPSFFWNFRYQCCCLKTTTRINLYLSMIKNACFYSCLPYERWRSTDRKISINKDDAPANSITSIYVLNRKIMLSFELLNTYSSICYQYISPVCWCNR